MRFSPTRFTVKDLFCLILLSLIISARSEKILSFGNNADQFVFQIPLFGPNNQVRVISQNVALAREFGTGTLFTPIRKHPLKFEPDYDEVVLPTKQKNHPDRLQNVTPEETKKVFHTLFWSIEQHTYDANSPIYFISSTDKILPIFNPLIVKEYDRDPSTRNITILKDPRNDTTVESSLQFMISQLKLDSSRITSMETPPELLRWYIKTQLAAQRNVIISGFYNHCDFDLFRGSHDTSACPEFPQTDLFIRVESKECVALHMRLKERFWTDENILSRTINEATQFAVVEAENERPSGNLTVEQILKKLSKFPNAYLLSLPNENIVNLTKQLGIRMKEKTDSMYDDQIKAAQCNTFVPDFRSTYSETITFIQNPRRRIITLAEFYYNYPDPTPLNNH